MSASGHTRPMRGNTPDHRLGSRTEAQRLGDHAERLAADRLANDGWTILATNVRIGRKEIDIVALDPGPPASIVLVEVRWRARRDYGLAEESFDRRKRAHLREAAGRLVAGGRLPDGRPLPRAGIRVDLVVVEPPTASGRPVRLRHHRDALAG